MLPRTAVVLFCSDSKHNKQSVTVKNGFVLYEYDTSTEATSGIDVDGRNRESTSDCMHESRGSV